MDWTLALYLLAIGIAFDIVTGGHAITKIIRAIRGKG